MNTSLELGIRVIQWEKLERSDQRNVLCRPVQTLSPEFSQKVRQIIESVRIRKDSALLDFTEQFDKVRLSSLKVTSQEMSDAYSQINPTTLKSLKEAIRRISIFHQAQLPKNIKLEISPGIECERRFMPIDRVGLYVPAGTAPLPSTVIMLGAPSRIAGCPTRLLATPPRSDQSIEPSILVAADLVGIQDIYKMGGAQAIAAMAYGTESIPKVDKIFGPGNSWVTEAKLQVSRDPSGATCDIPAGPSEVMVIADAFADPAFVAADLLSQAEHGRDSQVILITPSRKLIQDVQKELRSQLNRLPRREIASESLSRSLILEVSQLTDSIKICNEYAPEHLILNLKDPKSFAESITNAGSVFLGPWTPESAGDYASGTNHVLPTYGFARSLSGIGTESFMKSITFQELSENGLRDLGPTLETLALTENLEAHANAVRIRLQSKIEKETTP